MRSRIEGNTHYIPDNHVTETRDEIYKILQHLILIRGYKYEKNIIKWNGDIKQISQSTSYKACAIASGILRPDNTESKINYINNKCNKLGYEKPDDTKAFYEGC